MSFYVPKQKKIYIYTPIQPPQNPKYLERLLHRVWGLKWPVRDILEST